MVESAPGKNLIAYREWLTLEEMVKIFPEATGLPAQYVTLGPGEHDIPLPQGLKAELDDNWAYFNECGYEARNDPSVIHPSQVREAVCTDIESGRLTWWKLESTRSSKPFPTGLRSKTGNLFSRHEVHRKAVVSLGKLGSAE